MAEPDHVAELVRAMVVGAEGTPVTVKCRIGIEPGPIRSAMNTKRWRVRFQSAGCRGWPSWCCMPQRRAGRAVAEGEPGNPAPAHEFGYRLKQDSPACRLR